MRLAPRPFAVAAALTLTLALVACDGDDAAEPGSADVDASTASAADVVATTSATTEGPATASSTTAAPTSAPPATTAPTTAPSNTDTTDTTDATEASAAPVVTLVDPGAEPRQELRYRWTDGVEAMVAEQSQTIQQRAGGQSGPATSVDMVMVLDNDLTTGDDTTTIVQEVTEARPGDAIDPSIADQFAAALEPMVGLTTESVVDDRGQILSSSITSPLDDILPEVASTMESMSANQLGALLPVEPVGVGARWQVAQAMAANGIALTQTVEYELVEIDGDRVHLVGTGSQDAPLGPIEIAGMPADTEVAIESWDTAISVDVWIDLTSAVPESTTTSHSEQVIATTQGTLSADIGQTIDLTVTISRG